MKRKTAIILIIIFFLAVLGIISGSLIYQRFSKPGSTVISFLQDQGSVEVSFCPRDDCESILVAFLNSANSSLHCALFEIELESVKMVLQEKAKRMEVQVVIDNDYIQQFNNSFVKADQWGLMHNKFCIVDGRAVSTGSMNPTENDAHKNNNNLLLIHSPLLARNYEEEFQELWSGKFKGGEEVKNPQIRVGTVPLETYFCPEDFCAQRVKEELKKAKKSIQFMAFSFTHDGIANIILLKSLENISIQGILEARQVSEYSKFDVLQYQLGAENIVKDANKQNMHHKVFIIDEETVITGSFNPTEGGDERNDENVVIITDTAIADLFGEEFELLFQEVEK